jgi:pyruvate kinase
MNRKAKIVCTLGPATRSPEMIRALVDAGMDVARLNFSHGSREEHAQAFRDLRNVERDTGRPLAILQDLSGPKIRTGRLRGVQPIQLKAGASLTLTSRDVIGSPALVHISYPGLARDVRRGDRLLLSDGMIELRVESARSTRNPRNDEVRCRVVNGGELGERKGVNLPGVKLRVGAMTPKDYEDLAFGLELGVDYVALSFVRSAADVLELRRAIAKADKNVPVLAKLEKPEAIEHLEEILEASDGVMVARGDLGVEMAPEYLPVVQKQIIERAIAHQKPVITATQMLESMTTNPRPTRAEASDVANAVFDGTSAVMLSAETSTGQYPVETVKMMNRIVREAEAHARTQASQQRRERQSHRTIEEAMCENVAHTTQVMPVKAIVVFTRSGQAARFISSRRPAPPIYAFCHGRAVERLLKLYWGVEPRTCPIEGDIDTVIAAAERTLRREKLVRKGDIIASAAGTPFGSPGSLNLLKLSKAK